jgi:multiple sugar transport system ATP-binding protein
VTSALSVSELSVSFGKESVLKAITFDLRPAELLVILGPTGAGKTPLLRTLAGLETPSSGSIAIGDQKVTDMLPADRDVTMVFQNFSLYPDRSVRQNLAFPLRAPALDLPESEIDDRVDWAAGLLKISHLLDRPATQLSSGEMQRVAIGRAIVRRPRVFLLDEPLTNLDAKLRESLRIELIKLQRELETPMIYVTHDQAEALSMADRIAVLSEGRITQIGTPEDIYEAPNSPSVARLLGFPSINLFEAITHDGNWTIARDEKIRSAAAGAPSAQHWGSDPRISNQPAALLRPRFVL